MANKCMICGEPLNNDETYIYTDKLICGACNRKMKNHAETRQDEVKNYTENEDEIKEYDNEFKNNYEEKNEPNITVETLKKIGYTLIFFVLISVMYIIIKFGEDTVGLIRFFYAVIICSIFIGFSEIIKFLNKIKKK